MGPCHHFYNQRASVRRDDVRPYRASDWRATGSAQRNDLPVLQCVALNAADSRPMERGATAENRRRLDPAVECQVTTRPPVGEPAPEDLARAYRHRSPQRDRALLKHRLHIRPGESNHTVALEPHCGADELHFEGGRTGGVAHQKIRQSKCERIHGAGRRNPERPVADPTRIVLNARLEPGLDHGEAVRHFVPVLRSGRGRRRPPRSRTGAERTPRIRQCCTRTCLRSNDGPGPRTPRRKSGRT